ncbi:MAG: HEAT repeat domain-containing protein [Phycisphaerales bacterium]|nr:HEAT repeat domain-containing protein [Phycisphaerales bacterium]
MCQSSEPCRHGLRGVLAILLAFVLMVTVVQGWIALRDRPNQSQRIAAILVSWGIEPDGFKLPVNADEIARRVALLKSADGEERVRAAHWLAAHGVRDAGPAIASAMHDPGTLRPCQLAHALGHLGDEQWTNELIWAATQPWNRDLQVCATLGLEELASERAIDALIEIAEHGSARTSAIDALGVIGDARAVPDLQRIAAASEDRHTRETAFRALERIRLLTAADPVPALVERLTASIPSGNTDVWALRCLARLGAREGDGRAGPALARALNDESLSSRHREFMAACLVACGEEGQSALSGCSSSNSAAVRLVAQSALALVQQSSNAAGPSSPFRSPLRIVLLAMWLRWLKPAGVPGSVPLRSIQALIKR